MHVLCHCHYLLLAGKKKFLSNFFKKDSCRGLVLDGPCSPSLPPAWHDRQRSQTPPGKSSGQRQAAPAIRRRPLRPDLNRWRQADQAITCKPLKRVASPQTLNPHSGTGEMRPATGPGRFDVCVPPLPIPVNRGRRLILSNILKKVAVEGRTQRQVTPPPCRGSHPLADLVRPGQSVSICATAEHLSHASKGRRVSISSFVYPEGEVMAWHDFGNLEGPGSIQPLLGRQPLASVRARLIGHSVAPPRRRRANEFRGASPANR